MSFLAGLGGLLGGLGGLFGKKGDSAYKQTRDAMIGQAETARVAGEKYGFNPLTLLGASSPLGSNRGDGAPPLASVQMILGGIEEMSDTLSGNKAQKQAVDTFRRDLNTLRLDKTRSGVVVETPHYARDGFSTPSALGGNSVTVTPSNGVTHAKARFSSGDAGRPFSHADAQGNPVDVGGNPATSYVLNGTVIDPSENWSDAELLEQRTGEVGSSLVGLGVFGADLWKNREKLAAEQLGAKPIDQLPLEQRPPRWMAREWGRIPDVWDAGQPGWFVNGNPNQISYIAPNGKKVKVQ